MLMSRRRHSHHMEYIPTRRLHPKTPYWFVSNLSKRHSKPRKAQNTWSWGSYCFVAVLLTTWNWQLGKDSTIKQQYPKHLMQYPRNVILPKLWIKVWCNIWVLILLSKFLSQIRVSNVTFGLRKSCSFRDEWVSSCLTAHQHNVGYLVPLIQCHLMDC